MTDPHIHVGCAGWSIPAPHAARFPGDGSHLERYARVLRAVEINSSFYRPHQARTYERWARVVPEGFRFAVKAPREITHRCRLRGAEASAALGRFLGEVSGLGETLGPLLFQLPPSLRFETDAARGFFEGLREKHQGEVACEPRHASWFTPGVDGLLAGLRVARVASDPAPVGPGAEPGGWSGLTYFRLHGSPQTYRSSYSGAYLAGLAASLTAHARHGPAWCVFDNTAAGAATENALALARLLRAAPETRPRRVPERHDELLNVYDPAAVVIGAKPRREAKASGLAVGAVNALLVNARGEVLLQRRPADKENGALWDKSVGGHVGAGEEFDQTMVREAGEELFDDPASTRVRLAADEDAFRSLLGPDVLRQSVVLRRCAFQRNLRDVRRAPEGGLRNVVYHVAIYLGRTDLEIGAFTPQPSEIAELRYFTAAEVDRMLARGELAPNMAFLWLTQARALLDGA